MAHINTQPDDAPAINWPELISVFACLLVIVLALGITGRGDYQIALEQERDDLRVQLHTAQEQLHLANVSACTDMDARYGQVASAEVQP